MDREPLPDWVLERRETRELVGATLSSLPPDYRSALVAKYVDGQSVSEIGAGLGRGEKAAESVLTRARLAFSPIGIHGFLFAAIVDGDTRFLSH